MATETPAKSNSATKKTVKPTTPKVKAPFPILVMHTLQGPLIARVEETARYRTLHRPAYIQSSEHPARDGRIVAILRPIQFGARIDTPYGSSTILGTSPADLVLQELYTRFEATPLPRVTLDTLETARAAALAAEAAEAASSEPARAAQRAAAAAQTAGDEPPNRSAIQRHVMAEAQHAPPSDATAPAKTDKTGDVGARWARLSPEVRADLVAWSGLPEVQLTAAQRDELATLHTRGELRAWDCIDCGTRCFLGPQITGLTTLRNVDYEKYQGRGVKPDSMVHEMCDSCRARFDQMDTSANGSSA